MITASHDSMHQGRCVLQSVTTITMRVARRCCASADCFDAELFYTSSKSTLLIAIMELQEVECESHHLSVVFMHSFVPKFQSTRQASMSHRVQHHLRCSSSDFGISSSVGDGWSAVLLLDVLVILLVWRVNRNLDDDVAVGNFNTGHLLDSLLLELLGSKCDKGKSTTLARLVACLELADHEARNRAESDLGRHRSILLEDLHKLLLVNVVRKVGNHDLGL